jgi:hypothetical protein
MRIIVVEEIFWLLQKNPAMSDLQPNSEKPCTILNPQKNIFRSSKSMG